MGISQGVSQSYGTPQVSAPIAVGYVPMVTSPPPINRGYTMPQQVPYQVVSPGLAAPVAAGYLPMVASPLANHGNAGVLQHSLHPNAFSNGPAPIMFGYVPMSNTPAPQNINYARPMVTPRSYWTDMPTSSGQQSSHVYYGQTPKAQHHLQPEGSFLGQPSLLDNGSVTPSVPQGNALMVGDESNGDPGDAKSSDVSVGSKWHGFGLGHHKARCGCGARCCTSPWIVGIGGMVMTRDNENYYRFSYDAANEAIQLTNA